ncbi:MAG TPA: TldD/PmbA family protein [Firmicutes bacterium]|nr:TldD/PmbA family protein [Bacillota bacterium]
MIAKDLLDKVLQKAMSSGADFAEIFVERTKGNTIEMIDGKIDGITDNLIAGAGLRIFKGLRSIFASTTDLSEKGLLACAAQAAGALASGTAEVTIRLAETIPANIHRIERVPSGVPGRVKAEIIRQAYFGAKEYHPAISQVSARLMDTDRNILIANSDGLLTGDRQIRTRLFVSAVASRDGENQSGSAGPGRQMGLEMFDRIDPRQVGTEAARQAITMLSAGYCPAGRMPVAIENGFGGIIFHEACGHSLEATSVAKGRSQFTGRLGEQIANIKVTAVDDGTIPGAWGSVNIDDEGMPSQKNILIENGILKSYMIDGLNARRMGMAPTGSGRRQNYLYEPTSRMTNTYIADGPDQNEEIIRSIHHGLYAKQMGGGSVNPVTGEFNFSVTEGYMIRNGEIQEAVRGASLIGRGSDILMDIDMVGKNLDYGQGMCGSVSGSIPVNVGQPLLRVSSITVGGR